MSALTIAFIGVGNMGGPMARNLAASGHALRVFDLSTDLMQAVEGAQPSSSAVEACQGADVVISMLPAGQHVRGLYLEGADALLHHLKPHTLVIDSSTIDAATAKEVARQLADNQLGFLDAPVSGGTAGAEGGTLTFMVGGEDVDLERARPLLEAMGKNIFHAGAAGSGQVAKACNNMLLAIQMAGTAEALALGARNGLEPAKLSEIMQQSSGGNWCLNVYNPYPGVADGVPASRGYSGGFLTDLMCKDLNLAMQAAEQQGASVPMGALARSLFALHREQCDAGGLDFSSIQWLFDPQLRR